VHIGTGTGYYTAILAYLIGPSGRITGIEYEPELAARAKTNFAAYPNVDIVEGDGALVSFDTADVIYVSAGCTRPAESWLDRLADGGRLILPMTSDRGFGTKSLEKIQNSGAVFLIERRGEAYLAHWISAVAIFPCGSSLSHLGPTLGQKIDCHIRQANVRIGSIAIERFPRYVCCEPEPEIRVDLSREIYWCAPTFEQFAYRFDLRTRY
jgi:SAM-dependent methyltransferase